MLSSVSMTIGLDEEVNVDIYDVVDGGLLLLCSDGLTGNLRDEEIETLLRDGADARALVEAAKERGVSGDNITAVICNPR